MALPPPGKSQNVLITGASSGIGEQMSREFARLGYGVVRVARSADTLKAMAAELASAGVQAEAMPCDLWDPADHDRLLADQGRGAPLAALVNNAGFATVGRVSKSTVEAELGMVEVNINTVVHLCTALPAGHGRCGSGRHPDAPPPPINPYQGNLATGPRNPLCCHTPSPARRGGPGWHRRHRAVPRSGKDRLAR